MLKYTYKLSARNLPKAEGRGGGPAGRISKMRKLVTALVRHERLEGKYQWLDEARGYTERLIQEANRYGDTHAATMQTADFWLLEKDLVHKLFKVLVPRYSTYHTSCTRMWNLPTDYSGKPIPMAILELKGNPWPPVVTKESDISNSLINVLVEEARKEYRKVKFDKMASLRSLAGDAASSPVEITQQVEELTLEIIDSTSDDKPIL